MTVSRNLEEYRADRVYFAFGSNLCLSQMAQRCPESRYIGTAELPNYRFQINQRGFANIVYSPDDHVEGLLYLLSRTDEERLDRNEGVPTAYSKRTLTVKTSTAEITYVGRTVPEIAQRLKFLEPNVSQYIASTASISLKDRLQDESTASISLKDRLQDESTIPPLEEYSAQRIQPWRKRGKRITHLKNELVDDSNTHLQASRPGKCPYGCTDGEPTEALVYVSETFQKAGEPRNEYVDRMNAGIIDARKLGMSESYIENSLRRYIKYRPLPKQDHASARLRNLKGHTLPQKSSKSAGKDLPSPISRTRREDDTLMTPTQFEVKCKPRYVSQASVETGGNTNVRFHPCQDRGKRKYTHPRSSTGIIEDKRTGKLKPRSSNDDDIQKIGSVNQL